VFGEVEPAAGPQHPVDLGQGTLGLGDAAQRPGGEHVVHAAAVHRQVLPVQAGEIDWHWAGGDALGRQCAPQRGWVDRPDAVDCRRIVGDIEPGAEADLDYLTVQSGGDAGPDRAELFAGHDYLGDPGQDLAGIEPH